MDMNGPYSHLLEPLRAVGLRPTRQRLADISAADIQIKSMPAVPESMEISRVDVIIRVNKGHL